MNKVIIITYLYHRHFSFTFNNSFSVLRMKGFLEFDIIINKRYPSLVL